MQKIIDNLTAAFKNSHFSVPVFISTGLAIATIWFPKYTTELNATAAVLAGYGLIAMGNTPSQASQANGADPKVTNVTKS